MYRSVNLKAGWWQLKYFLCSPRSLGKSMIQFDEHVFQLGWFNHQLAKPCYKTNLTSSAAPKPGGFLCGLDGEWSGSPRCVSWTWGCGCWWIRGMVCSVPGRHDVLASFQVGRLDSLHWNWGYVNINVLVSSGKSRKNTWTYWKLVNLWVQSR